MLMKIYCRRHDSCVSSGGSRPSDKVGEGGHPDPDIRGGGAVSKKNVSALWASAWSKNKGGGGQAPSPGSASAKCLLQ